MLGLGEGFSSVGALSCCLRNWPRQTERLMNESTVAYLLWQASSVKDFLKQ